MSAITQHLGVEFGYRFFSTAMEKSREGRAIQKEMLKYGLKPQPERSHVFNVFSADHLRSIAIAITPYSSEDVNIEGGLSISEGGHAQGVIVQLKNRTEVVGFTHFAVTRGKVVTSKQSVKLLLGGGSAAALPDSRIKAIAERVGKVKTAKPLVEIEAHQVRSMATVAYNGLLGDQFSKTVHDDAEVAKLRGNTELVAQISLFVYFRTQGSACCSCSCCCWGSSSCSSSYIQG